MSDDPRRLTTDEQRAWFSAARERGGLCAACGRVLGEGEPVYIDQVLVDRKPFAAPGAGWRLGTTLRDVPLGSECASPAFLARTKGQEPEGCAHCGRPVYYEVAREGRRRATCSHRCGTLARRASGPE